MMIKTLKERIRTIMHKLFDDSENYFEFIEKITEFADDIAENLEEEGIISILTEWEHKLGIKNDD